MRLTQAIRSTMENAIIEHRFGKVMEAAVKEAAEAGDALHAKLFPVRTWFKTDKALLYWAYGSRAQFGSDFVGLRFSKKMPVPNYNTIQVPAEFKELFDVCYVCQSTENRIKEERLKTQREVRQALAQYNTSNQLKEGWPEAAAFLPPEPSKEKGLVIVPGELNKKLNLPV